MTYHTIARSLAGNVVLLLLMLLPFRLLGLMLAALVVAAALTACTTQSVEQPEFEPSRVIERIGNAADTPVWASGADPFFREAGDIVFVATVTMSGDARPEACTAAAADLGRVQLLRQIRDHLTTSGQLTEHSASSDPVLESLLAFLSQGQVSGLRVAARYWEKREESDPDGRRILRVHCATKVAIDRGRFESQVAEAMSGGPDSLGSRLRDMQKKFIDAVGALPEAGRTPGTVPAIAPAGGQTLPDSNNQSSSAPN